MFTPQPIINAAMSHSTKVMLLYRRALKTAFDWSDNRQIYYQMALQIRKEFRQHQHIRDPFILNKLLADGEKRILEKAHAAPYIHPESPGGSRWERNIPPPVHLTKESAFVEF